MAWTEAGEAALNQPNGPRLERLLNRQIEAWLAGNRLTVESLLAEQPSVPGDERLLALVINELALREGLGETSTWEEYARRFPQLVTQLRPRFFPSQQVAPATARLDPPLPTLRPSQAPTVPTTFRGSTGQRSLPGYDILEELGRGAMGVVYKARQRNLNRIVALKMILSGDHASSDELARFRLEAEAVGQLKHPNIVQVFDTGEHEGRSYFSLEFVEGGSLDRKLGRKTLPAHQAAELVEALARAMHSAHEQGIIHRDLKPANILLTADGTPKITDFGLAKQLSNQSAQTASGAVMGTPSYMSPEQADGRLEEVGPRSDVYSLGAILYTTLTGRPPFVGATVVETLAQVLNDDPLPPSRLQPGVPRDLETICLKCLAKTPQRRYESAAELADDLRHYLQGEPIKARAMGRAERLWVWCRRNPVAASLLLTIALGSAFGMWYLSRLSQEVVRMSALESAVQHSELFDRLNDFYSAEVVDRAKQSVVKPFGGLVIGGLGFQAARSARVGGVTATHAYHTEPGTIPTPATLTIDLGRYISSKSQRGMQVRLYSDEPFKSRKDGGVRDQFERDALLRLREKPNQPYYSFEEVGGRAVLRYATARVMKQSCVDCHNTHPDSPRDTWEVGDVRGVLEIIRPLDQDQERAQAALRGTIIPIGGLCVGLLLFSGLVFVLGKRARRAPQKGRPS